LVECADRSALRAPGNAAARLELCTGAVEINGVLPLLGETTSRGDRFGAASTLIYELSQARSAMISCIWSPESNSAELLRQRIQHRYSVLVRVSRQKMSESSTICLRLACCDSKTEGLGNPICDFSSTDALRLHMPQFVSVHFRVHFQLGPTSLPRFTDFMETQAAVVREWGCSYKFRSDVLPGELVSRKRFSIFVKFYFHINAKDFRFSRIRNFESSVFFENLDLAFFGGDLVI
jgi:hypothetical protein